jgi:hypothetical protein
MSTQLQLRRGTAADNAAFTGASGEAAYATDTKRLALHDGSTAGGTLIPNYKDLQSNPFTFATAGGTANALTASTTLNPTSLTAGLAVDVKIASANTGAATLAWGSTTATAIKKFQSGSKVDVAAGDLVAGQVLRFTYDGTHWLVGGMVQEIPPTYYRNTGYTTGRYYLGLISEWAVGTNITANRLYAYPYVVAEDVTFASVSVEVHTLQSGNIRLGIYNILDGLPTTLIQDFGTVSTSTTGIKTISSINLTLAAGIYAVACVASSASRFYSLSITDSAQTALFTHILGPSSMVNVGNNAWKRTFTYAALPASAGFTASDLAGVNEGIPLFGFSK